MMYFEDRLQDREEVEQIMLRPFSATSSIDRLRALLLSVVLTGASSHSAARCVLMYASQHSAGQYIKDHLERGVLDDLHFKTRRPLIETDLLLQPWYGHVLPALDELVRMGLPDVTRDFLVQSFRRNNAVERVRVVAVIVTWGAMLILDAVDPMFGQSTPFATNMRTPTVPPGPAPPELKSAVIATGSGVLYADGDV